MKKRLKRSLSPKHLVREVTNDVLVSLLPSRQLHEIAPAGRNSCKELARYDVGILHFGFIQDVVTGEL